MYNQILLGPYCLCSTLLLGCKKCAAKVICSFSARCLWRAESCRIHFSCWYCDDFLFLLLYVFPSRQKWSWGGNLAPDTLFIQSHTQQRKVWTVHYTRLNLCRCIQQLHSNTPSSSLSSPPSDYLGTAELAAPVVSLFQPVNWWWGHRAMCTISR